MLCCVALCYAASPPHHTTPHHTTPHHIPQHNVTYHNTIQHDTTRPPLHKTLPTTRPDQTLTIVLSLPTSLVLVLLPASLAPRNSLHQYNCIHVLATYALAFASTHIPFRSLRIPLMQMHTRPHLCFDAPPIPARSTFPFEDAPHQPPAEPCAGAPSCWLIHPLPKPAIVLTLIHPLLTTALSCEPTRLGAAAGSSPTRTSSLSPATKFRARNGP